MIQILRLQPEDHDLLAQEQALREQVLLGPIGYDIARFIREYPGLEEAFEHFVAVFNHPQPDGSVAPRVIGCACLLPHHPDQGIGKLMQMAVDLQRQGEGIGRRLVMAVESRAFGELGIEELFCHARDEAMPFYEKLGWATDPEGFTEAGIPHHRMTLRANGPA
ncbi:MAG: GNAT family N-acetyltransferase [Phycisphaerales bacterium]|nr:MAG: GNAT family N-acetyltransferase [Phycisphaerales bacterium]